MEAKLSGLWVVLYNEGKCFIGKVVGTYGGGSASFLPESHDFTQEEVLMADRVTLKPVFDFFAPLRPVQQPGGAVGFSRDPIVTPLDFTMDDLPVHVGVGAVSFLEDMSEEDYKTYKGFIDNAQNMKEATKRARAVESSGLVLVGADGKPKGPGGAITGLPNNRR